MGSFRAGLRRRAGAGGSWMGDAVGESVVVVDGRDNVIGGLGEAAPKGEGRACPAFHFWQRLFALLGHVLGAIGKCACTEVPPKA